MLTMHAATFIQVATQRTLVKVFFKWWPKLFMIQFNFNLWFRIPIGTFHQKTCEKICGPVYCQPASEKQDDSKN